MENISTRQLEKFIAHNTLSQQQGTILFNATVTFYENSKPVTISSEIQIIRLPEEMVLYVLDFTKDQIYESEIYSTRLCHFVHLDSNELQIKSLDGNSFIAVTVAV